MPAPKHTAAELMDLIAARAPALIAAGVTELTIDGFSVKLAAPPPPPVDPKDKPAPPPKPHIDPLKDASTYPGGRVPGYRRDPDRSFE